MSFIWGELRAELLRSRMPSDIIFPSRIDRQLLKGKATVPPLPPPTYTSPPVTDISTSAGLYSALAAVLAGFALTALILILTTRIDSSPGEVSVNDAFASATRVLVVAFIGLVLTSVNYASLAGDKVAIQGVPIGRSALIEIVDGLGFAASGILMTYAIALTLDGVRHFRSATSMDLTSVSSDIKSAIVVFVMPLLIFMIYLGNQDLEDITSYSRNCYATLPPVCETDGITLLDVACVTIIVLTSLVIARHYFKGAPTFMVKPLETANRLTGKIVSRSGRMFGRLGDLIGLPTRKSRGVSELLGVINRVADGGLALILITSISGHGIAAFVSTRSRIPPSFPIIVLMVGLAFAAAFAHNVRVASHAYSKLRMGAAETESNPGAMS